MMFRPFLILVISLGLYGCRSSNSSSASAPRQNTDTARAENDRAFELLKSAKYDQAEQALKRAMAADVMFGPARNNLGLVYYHQDKLYAAAWEFQNAIKLMPHQSEPRNNLGLVLEKAGKLEGAAEAYSKAREMEPDNPEYLGNLARARIRHGDRDEQTRKLLEELVLKDDRPEWRDWAQLNLLRMRRGDSATQPAM
jgi:Flp pilus assembly protein TadD